MISKSAVRRCAPVRRGREKSRMPRAIVDKLNAAVRQMLQSQDVIERFTALNLTPVGGTPEEFAKFLKEDYARYVAVAKAAGIQPQ